VCGCSSFWRVPRAVNAANGQVPHLLVAARQPHAGCAGAQTSSLVQQQCGGPAVVDVNPDGMLAAAVQQLVLAADCSAAIQPPPHQKALPWASGLGPPPAPATRRCTHPAVPACRARRPHMACSLQPAGMDGVAMAALTSEFCCSQLAAAAALPPSPPPSPPPPPLPRPACSAAASAHHGGHPAQLASQQRRHLFTCLRWRAARRRAEAVVGVGLKPSCWPPCCTQTRGNI
jgi:hypothetical protein